MHDICPFPRTWADAYEALLERWNEAAGGSPGPPRPLILAGWAYSNDVDKQRRWQQTVQWARGRGWDDLVRIPPEAMYRVHEPTDYPIGPGGGPMYLDWDFTPKRTPADQECQHALDVLTGAWDSIAAEVAHATWPLRFSGAKRRRLVVLADRAVTPPWGGWDWLAPGETRRTFTRFRQRVNAAIARLHVDHIDFDARGEFPRRR
jgi:hypothetical protein